MRWLPSTHLVMVIFVMTATFPAYGQSCMNMHVIQNSPIGFVDVNGQPAGVHWDYLVAIEKKSGVCINKLLMPYARLWESLAHGEHDGGIIFRSPDRDALVDPVALIRTLQTVVVPRNNVVIKSYQDLNGLMIGKTRGTKLNDRFDVDYSLNKYDLNDYQQGARMIKAGRIDAIAGSGVVLNFQLARYSARDDVNWSGSFNLGGREQWLLLSKKSSHLDKISKLKQAIEELRSEGTLDEIMTRYYGEEWRAANRLSATDEENFKNSMEPLEPL